MKKFARGLGIFAAFIVVLVIVAFIRGDQYLFKGLWACYLHGYNTASIDDARFFETHPVTAGNNVWQWPLSNNYNKEQLSQRLSDELKKTGTVAFVVIQNDSILHEHYDEGYTDSSRSNSFSMAKSITTMLAQIAIQKGVFTGWNQPVKTIFPDLKGTHANELQLWHLSTMSSGLLWDEAYKNPWSVTAKAYYGNNIKELMLSLPISDTPGQKFNYQSGSTELLAMCLMQKTGKTLAELATEWLWQPLQAQHSATWHTDGTGTEMAYCCFNTDARDFARFGKLMLHSGNWNGTQVLDSQFVQLATKPALAPEYGYSFWLDDSRGTKVFYQWGLLGQYIISIPEYNVCIVRLGKHEIHEANSPHNEDFHVIVEEVLKMVKKS